MFKRGILTKPAGFSRWLGLAIIGLVLFFSLLMIWLFWQPSTNQTWPPGSYVGLVNNKESLDNGFKDQAAAEPVLLAESCLVGDPCPFKIKAVDPEGDRLVYEFYSLPDKKILINQIEADSGQIISPAIIFNKPGEIIFSVVVKDEAGHAAPEKQLLALVKDN